MNIAYEDLIDGSCLNGWTMGNLAATPQALAGALYNIFGTKPIAPILSSESIAQMMSFSPVRAVQPQCGDMIVFACLSTLTLLVATLTCS